MVEGLTRWRYCHPAYLDPKEGSCIHSKQKQAGPEKEALLKQQSNSTTGNATEHVARRAAVVNRELSSPDGIELTIRLFTPPDASLAESLPNDPDLERLDPGVSDYTQVPLVATPRTGAGSATT